VDRRAGLDAVGKRNIFSLPRTEPRQSSPWSVAIPSELSPLLQETVVLLIVIMIKLY
jgi:hypothetical protein